MIRKNSYHFHVFFLLAWISASLAVGRTAPAPLAALKLSGSLVLGSQSGSLILRKKMGFASAGNGFDFAATTSIPSGDQLSCMTLTSPHISSTSKADSDGGVSVQLPAQGEPLSCFVLDSTGAIIAPISFHSSGIGSSQGVTFSESASLGVITVDTAQGTAQATLPSAGTLVVSTAEGP